MAKFTYNDIVAVKPSVKIWIDVPIPLKPGPRVGERAWVCGVCEDRQSGTFSSGTTYTVEFEDGSAIEVHEDDLDLIEAAQ